MKDFLLLRFDAPLISFGGPAVDNFGVVQDFPALSLLTGLLANALGYEHRETEKLQALQERLRYAVRRDRPGQKILDFQTVDLGQDFLTDTGWTTRNTPEGRQGGTASTGTHIRYRHFWADSVYTIALTLAPEDTSPTLSDLEQALSEPERPLFLGRKGCLPAAPVLLQRLSAPSLYEALLRAPLLPEARRPHEKTELSAWWPEEEGPGSGGARLFPVSDARDWTNQIHVGRRLLYHGVLSFGEMGDER